MSNAPKKRRRGRPPGEFALALSVAPPKYLAELHTQSNRTNADVLGDPRENAAATAKTRREVMQHFQKVGGEQANDVRNEVRVARFDVIQAALRDPLRNLAKLSDSRAAEILSVELGLSPNTLRRDIAEIRKLIGPTS